MSRYTSALSGSLGSGDAQPNNNSLRQWIYWLGSQTHIYMSGLLHHFIGFQSSSDIGPSFDSAISSHRISEYSTSEKVYRFDSGRVLKRSLKQDEYKIGGNGERLIPTRVVERLKNETACMKFVREHTNIPVPKVLDAYEENGCYYLSMEFIKGTEMSKLSCEQQTQVIPQSTYNSPFRSFWVKHWCKLVRDFITILQELRSNITGGPSGILSPPSIVYFDHLSEWEQQRSTNEDFVFCHGDLSQGNILVDPETLKVVAIIDWEYGGFFPPKNEIPFYESSDSSGEQLRSDKHKPIVDSIIDFWKRSQVSAA